MTLTIVRPAAVAVIRPGKCLGRLPHMCDETPVAVWVTGGPYHTPNLMCRACLNRWLDRADDKPSLEPYELRWLAAT